jgi:hypothetical protein
MKNGKNGKAAEQVEPKAAFARFEGAMQQILTVSKKEVLRREKVARRGRKRHGRA